MFRKTAGPVDLNDHRNWWEYVPGVNWKRPGGKGTTINGPDTHPVVHIAYEDAEADAACAGKELPTAQARVLNLSGELPRIVSLSSPEIASASWSPADTPADSSPS